jgi:hypothetical protein
LRDRPGRRLGLGRAIQPHNTRADIGVTAGEVELRLGAGRGAKFGEVADRTQRCMIDRAPHRTALPGAARPLQQNATGDATILEQNPIQAIYKMR